MISVSCCLSANIWSLISLVIGIVVRLLGENNKTIVVNLLYAKWLGESTPLQDIPLCGTALSTANAHFAFLGFVIFPHVVLVGPGADYAKGK